MSTENTLASALATPVPLMAKTQKSEITLYFKRVTIAHREMFSRRFGKGGIEKALESIDLTILSEALYLLLTKESKESLDEIKDDFLDYDPEDDEKLINIAPKRMDRLKFILGSDPAALYELVLNVHGTSTKEVQRQAKIIEKLPADKKKEVKKRIQELTGQQ